MRDDIAQRELKIDTTIFSSGFDAALRRSPRIRFLEGDANGHSGRPRAITIHSHSLPRGSPKVHSYSFSIAGESSAPATVPSRSAANLRSATAGSAIDSGPKAHARRTWLRPPGDVIKLSDRLYFLLQPPLQTFLDQQSLALPFAPFPYQWDGIAFLYPRVAAILADEMGLGKTMQAITAIRLLLKSREVSSVLLVCPKPLVTNWQNEFSVWAAEIPLVIIEGTQSRRQWQWQLTNTPVKIANYEVVSRDYAFLQESGIPFDLMVLDEAQRIKNRRSLTSEACRAIQRRRSWALTGTPVENSGEDLLGIFEFLAPGHLSPDMPVSGMAKATGDYILRRTKSQVLTDLPPKMIRDARLELSATQRQSYDDARTKGIVRLSELGSKITIQHVLELVLRLKQICNFDPGNGDSPKLEQMLADIDEIASSGAKAIVFSQWVDTLQRIKSHVQPYGALEFHGRIPPSKRDAILKQFRHDEQSHVLLMTYGAGSVGLNLQFANYVFLFDRWWNPAVEDQAINRAHRIGATGPVTVTRFIAVDTIEERIHDILEQKRELFELILSHAHQGQRLGLSPDELFGLFQLNVP